jgi:hypothetical protein
MENLCLGLQKEMGNHQEAEATWEMGQEPAGHPDRRDSIPCAKVGSAAAVQTQMWPKEGDKRLGLKGPVCPDLKL